MSAGTITLANNSNAVAGIDTSFTTELAVGDFIVVTTGGVTYTLPVKSIESDTALTLARNYNGPAVTAGAWTAMPRDTLNRISAQIAADTAYAIRQRVLEIDNWYQLLEVNGEVTIKMADGSSYTGPSWLKLIDVMNEMQIDQIIPIAEQIRADAQQVAEDKPVIIQAKDDAEAAATAASASEENAATSEDNAASSASTASTKADEAAESARQAAESNPANYLLKDNNLQDLADRAAAWLNVRPVGSTPLAAAAVNDGDAPQWLQVKNLISSGSGGPTMNGVMNYHVGEAVPWETRAYYPPNCLPRDGQLVNRADWPELWAWAQKTSPITDAVWLADVTKRGSYSTGDGSTTFRLPDWNGIQSGSIPANFFRGGDGANDMVVVQNAAPALTFSMNDLMYNTAAGGTVVQSGALKSTIINKYTMTAGNGNGAMANMLREFSAASQNDAYGRNSAGEIRPNNVCGVWLVRASGGFVAANTSWSVINSLTSAPGVSTTTYGGDVNSTLKVGTADYGKAGLRAVVTSDASGVKTVGAQVVVTDSTGSTSTQKVINLGTVNGLTGGSISGTYLGLAGSSTGGFVGLEINNTASDPAGCYYNAVMNGYVRGGIEITNDRDGKSGYALRLLFSRNNSVTTDHREPGLSINSNGTTWMVSQPTYGSDERLKKEVEDIGSTRDALRTLRTSRYVMDGRRQIGLIAQDVQKYWPELIDNFEKVTYSESGEKTEGTYLSLNYTGMIAPTIKAVNENSDTIDKLMDIVREAIKTIAGVTTDELAKAALEALAERIPAPDAQ